MALISYSYGKGVLCPPDFLFVVLSTSLAKLPGPYKYFGFGAPWAKA
jgi:hypothetical protein